MIRRGLEHIEIILPYEIRDIDGILQNLAEQQFYN